MPKENETASGEGKAAAADTLPDFGAVKTPQAAAASSSQASASSGATGSSAGAAKSAGNAQDAISLLKQDHRTVEALFKRYEGAEESAKDELIEQICQELIVHALVEEEIFYPASRQGSTEDQLDEAQVEHDCAKVLIRDLLLRRDEYRDAKVKVLAEEITTHIKEEEASDGVFAKAQKAGVNTAELGGRLMKRKEALLTKARQDALPLPRLISLHPFERQTNQEEMMARQSNDRGNDRDRDDRGRFMSDDDDRGRSYGYSSRGRGDQDRDERGRFMSDDDRDRDYRSRGRDYDEDDRGGRYRGRMQGGSRDEERGGERYGRSYRDDDDDRGYRSRGREDDDRGRGGWFGDPEGHSRASREGWEDRGGSRSRASEDRSFSSRGGGRDYDEDDDRRGRSRSDRGQGGWFGDSEGHSRAAREGWEDRGGSRARSRDEDDRGYRSRDRDDDDDRGRSHSGGRSSGQGGWFGDREGHAQAARRGWDDRR